MAERSIGRVTIENAVEVLLPLFLIALLVALCVQLLLPFVGLLLWTIILAICFFPLHRRLVARMKPRWSATIIGAGLAILILAPTAIAATSAASGIPHFVAALHSGEQRLPPPPERIADIPIVGQSLHATWTQ